MSDPSVCINLNCVNGPRNHLGQAKLIYSLSSGLFLKCMWAGGHFSFFIISFGPVHVATETII